MTRTFVYIAQMFVYFQSIRSGLFQMFDFGPEENMKKYNQVINRYCLYKQICSASKFTCVRAHTHMHTRPLFVILYATHGILLLSTWSVGQTEIYGLFCKFVTPPFPQEEKLGYYFLSGTCLGALETHVLLSFLWPIACNQRYPTDIENSSTHITRPIGYFTKVSIIVLALNI